MPDTSQLTIEGREERFTAPQTPCATVQESLFTAPQSIRGQIALENIERKGPLMSLVHNGVLIPADMQDRSPAQLDEYARAVKENSAAFCAAHFALETQAERLGIELDA